jgi:hypothetical protein
MESAARLQAGRAKTKSKSAGESIHKIGRPAAAVIFSAPRVFNGLVPIVKKA